MHFAFYFETGFTQVNRITEYKDAGHWNKRRIADAILMPPDDCRNTKDKCRIEK